MSGYIVRKGLSGEKKFPLTMMLEPLHTCNLTCTGCGRIREYKSTINEMLTSRWYSNDVQNIHTGDGLGV